MYKKFILDFALGTAIVINRQCEKVDNYFNDFILSIQGIDQWPCHNHCKYL